jgi:uncharacterized membrane protein
MKMHVFMTWLLSITLLTLVLRFLFLDRPSFWIDEIYSVYHSSRLGEGNITKQFGFLPTYLVLKLFGALPAASEVPDPSTWASLGVTEWVVRLPSVIVGILSVPILGMLAKPLIGPRAAVLFMLMLAVSTWHLHMSQTGRFYIQEMLFYNMSLLLFFRATTAGSRKHLYASLICLFAAYMSQPLAIILGLIFAVDWFFGLLSKEESRLTRLSFIAGAITAAVCIALWVYDYKSRPENWDQFAQTTSQSAKIIIAGAIWYINPAVVITAAAGFLWLIQRERRLGTYLSLAAVLPIVIMAGMALDGRFIHVRYTFIVLPAWVLLAAVTVDKSTRKSLAEYPVFIRGIPAALILVACLYQDIGYYTGGGGYRPAWRDAMQDLDTMRKPGDAIYGDTHAHLIGAYYLQENAIQEITRSELMPILDESDEECWVIDKVGTSGGLNWGGLRHRADLIWTYDRHILQPYSSIKLFHYVPNLETLANAEAEAEAGVDSESD